MTTEGLRGPWRAGRTQILGYIYVFTGLRGEEATHVLADNVDIDRGIIVIEPLDDWRPKTVPAARPIPMAAVLREKARLWKPRCGSRYFIPGWRRKTPWSGGPGYKPLDMIRQAGERAGIKDLTRIGLRKSIGTLGKAMGLGQLEMAAILGHSNVETQRHYDEEAIESLRPAMAKIDAFFARAM